MSEALKGTPDKVAEQVFERYEPLRDSRAYSEPERKERKFLETSGYLMVLGGLGLEAFLLVASRLSPTALLFGVIVAGLGLVFVNLARRPLKFAPPEPLENLAALSQSLGLCRSLSKAFPSMVIELHPISCTVRGSCDGYDWETRVNREGLKLVGGNKTSYDNYTIEGSTKKIWKRSSTLASKRQRIVWSVTVDGEFNPRPGQPSTSTALESCESGMGKTVCTFTLPINEPDKPGLGHEGRTDYISSPLGLHHPEFVGEQIALSLVWMFNPHARL